MPLITKNGIEDFVRGALVHRAQKIDLQVHNALRNFLFLNVKFEIGLDLVAMNIQRGRDHGLPSYNKVRTNLRFPKVDSFSEITSNLNVQSMIKSAYGSVDQIDPWIGLVAEDHEPNSSMGRSMLKIWAQEFRQLRDGDSFYYRNERRPVFSKELKSKIPRVQALFTEEDAFRGIVLRNTNIKNNDLPKRMFFWD